ncbi:MAG: hypothetical protein COB67_03945 [SAR324 cluster bacterium]|uniref:histidine kinase n=1 Tax=SAR324 cluster bacterium TaxID=2024889 RepID=A0A2A4T937_9DELT|nr:MAG: hypothetical protein COB67_03945 [SAR324 cluster bacterium]
MSDNDELLIFVDDTDSEIPQLTPEKQDFWKVILVDDEESVHQVTKIALSNFEFRGKRLQFFSAYTGIEAKQLIEKHPDTAVILLDVVMEEDNTGLELIKYIRNQLKNSRSRIILRTGQPGQAPEKKIVAEYDIHDYKTKTELTTQKLFTMMVTALRSYQEIMDAIASRQQLEQERNIFVSGPVSVLKWAKDPGLSVVYISPNAKDLLGYSVEELTEGRLTYTDLIHPEDVEQVHSSLMKFAEENRENFEQEYRVVCKDGKILWLHVFISPVRDEWGNVSQFIGYIIDATLQKEQEKLLFEKVIEGIVFTDLNDRVLKLNQTMAEIAGISRPEAEGMDIYNLMVPEHQALYREKSILVMAEGQAQRFELNILKSQREPVPCLVTLTPLKDLSEEVTGFFIFMIDLTERKNIEKELRTSLEAEKRFIASVSHEIRTPLSSIMGYTELLNETDTLSETQKNYCSHISVNSKHLLTLINDILDISKIEADQLELTETKTNLSEVLIESGVMISSRIQKDVKLEVDIDEFNFYFQCDPVRIRQIFINLLGNAAKFTKSGVIKLYLKGFEELEDNRVRLRICVEDTGIGIPEEKQRLLFQAFKQAHMGDYGGTGLGLYLSRSVAQLMEGTIEVESEEGVGSQFTVTLVLKKGDDKDEAHSFSGKKILLLENDPILSRMLQEKLENVGAHLIQLKELENTSQVFRESLRLEALDAVVIDMDILKEKSLYIAGSLKEIFPDIVIIGIKQETNPLQLSELDSLLMKPFSFYQLAKELNKGFGRINKIQSDVSSLKILLVEDIEANRQLFCQMFKKFFNLIPDVATNGREAVEAIRDNTYDGVFMDVQMPVMDGIEAATEIRKFNQEVKIIAMTGNVFVEDIQLTQQAGMDGFLAKPVQREDLQNVLNSLMVGDDSIMQQKKVATDDPLEIGTKHRESIYDFIRKLSDDEATAHELVELTVDEIKALLDRSRDCFKNKDHQALLSTLHALKGVLYNCGLNSLGEIVQEIERSFQHQFTEGIVEKSESLLSQEFGEFIYS